MTCVVLAHRYAVSSCHIIVTIIIVIVVIITIIVLLFLLLLLLLSLLLLLVEYTVHCSFTLFHVILYLSIELN